ncbi:MAG: S41 family peptidase [Pseudomonadota bacterium]
MHFWHKLRRPSLWVGLLFLSPLAIVEAQIRPADRELTPNQVRSDVALAKEVYERLHPGYTRYASKADLDAGWAGVVDRAIAENGMTVGDFYLAIERTLVGIRCDHTKAELPRDLRLERETARLYLPARWLLIEGRALVYEGGEDTRLNYGDEILSVDGRPMSELVAEVAPLIPVDGFTEWSRRGGISESREFMGGALDHFGALLWEVGPTATLEVQNSSGETRTETVERLNYQQWRELGDGIAGAANFKDAVQLERLGDRAAYLRVDTFVNYRDPVKPDEIYDPIFKALRSENRDFLILDLRRNGGGSNDAQFRLLAHLTDKRLPIVKDMRAKTLNLGGVREHLWTWDKTHLDPPRIGYRENEDGTFSPRRVFAEDLQRINPDRYAFEGQLIVLTSTENSSGSTMLLSVLKELSNATFIGEPTGGSAEGPTAGIQFTLTLPESRVRTRVPFFRYYVNVSTFDSGLGVTPDISAPMTIAAFRDRRDPAKEAAVALLESR